MSSPGGDAPRALRLVSSADDTRSFRACGSTPTTSVHSTLMSRIDGIRSAFPLRLAQAYEPDRTAAVRRAQPIAAAEPRFQVSSVQAATAVSATRSSQLDKLVAGRVDVPISFPGDSPIASRGSAGSYALHTQPADLNSAATGVSVGRMIDVTA